MFNVKIIGQRIRKLRGKQLLKDVAPFLGISKQMLSNIETGYRDATIDVAFAAAEYFNASLDYLTGRDEYTPPPASRPPTCAGCGEEVEIHFTCGCGDDRAVFTSEELQERNEQDRANHGQSFAFTPSGSKQYTCGQCKRYTPVTEHKKRNKIFYSGYCQIEREREEKLLGRATSADRGDESPACEKDFILK